MKPAYETYRPRSILNVHKHVDGWFYDKYSAHPYVGCAFGCAFCYCREAKYLRGGDPAEFDRRIRVKVNAVERLRQALQGRPIDLIACGDWQLPAERDHRLSRGMLEVVLELGFPLLVLERSPYLTCDLDLLVEINRRTWVSVVYSMSTLDPAVKRAFEPRSPGVRRRLAAMDRLAAAGLLVGTALMPVLPVVADDDAHLEEMVVATVEHGGRFLLGGSLTMAEPQASWVRRVVAEHFPAARPAYQQLYAGGSYGPPPAYSAELGRRVRALCQKHALPDRMPRWIEPGPRGVNRRVAEQLFQRVWDLELEEADERRIWAYRRAAWTVDELADPIDALYAEQGTAGLMALPGIGQRLAGQIAAWLRIHGSCQKEV